MYTILDLLKEDGLEPKWVASTNDDEYSSPCPGCGGEDRFQSWPNQGDGGRWWCRVCKKNGDLIQYLREFRNLSFKESLLFLKKNQPAVDCEKIGTTSENKIIVLNERTDISSPELWKKKAKSLIEAAEKELWTLQNIRVRQWLHERGLKDKAIKQNRLGWNTEDFFCDRKKWGLTEQIKENGRPRKCWIPAGLVIPCFANNKIVRVFIRRSNPTDLNLPPIEGPRYFLLKGSKGKTPLILGEQKKRAIVVESDLDAMLIEQEAGDLIQPISLGSAMNKPDGEAQTILNQAKIILVSLDRDEAGMKAAWTWWFERYPSAVRWPSAKGKDPGEDYRAGTNIRDWIIAGLPEPEITEIHDIAEIIEHEEITIESLLMEN